MCEEVLPYRNPFEPGPRVVPATAIGATDKLCFTEAIHAPFGATPTPQRVPDHDRPSGCTRGGGILPKNWGPGGRDAEIRSRRLQTVVNLAVKHELGEAFLPSI